jgi:glycerol-3-phosphate dehydrogenase
MDYLVAETNRVFPEANLGIADINFAYAGVRPLPYREKGPESAITRRHIIKVNRKIAKGLISIIGGKLTTYRNLAEQTVDRLAKILRRKLPECRTRDTLLPGAWGIDRAREQVVASTFLTQKGTQRLLSIYGGRAAAIIEMAIAEPGLQEKLDGEGNYLAAEVAFAVREEFATTLTDVVFRRMMTGLNADQGRPLYDAIASRLAAECGWSAENAQDELRALLDYANSLRVSDSSAI